MKDFLQNRPRVSAPRRTEGVNPTEALQSAPIADAELAGPRHVSGDGHEPVVEVIKEGDRVTKLIVTCRCGEKIEILCAYPPGTP